MAPLFGRLAGKKEKQEKNVQPAPVKSVVEVRHDPAVAKKSAPRFTHFSLIPHVTEKTTRGAEHGWYTFRIPNEAGKIAVKGAVENRYGVHVTSVRVRPVLPRRVRIGRAFGHVPGFKKASVKLKEGESIDFT